MREPNEIDRMKGRLILAQCATYQRSGYRSCWPTVAHESLSPLNRFEAHCTVEAWLQMAEFSGPGFKLHIHPWYRTNGGRAHESATEPEGFRDMRHQIEEFAAAQVIVLESEGS